MEKIPVIGTAVVNNPYWVRRMIMSVDYPVENLVIVNNNGRGIIDQELDEIARMSHDFIDKIKVVHMPANIGVAGYMNLVIKCYMNAPYWILVNDDIAFKPGCLQEMAEYYQEDPDWGMVHPNVGDFELGSWDCFAIGESVIRLFGLFDENTYPAYCEDADYIMRMTNMPIKKAVGCENTFIHGHADAENYYDDNGGSRTKKSDEKLDEILTAANETNFEYLNQKWGIHWRGVNPTKLPFEDEPHHISETRWDLDFVRSKHTGF